MIKLEVEDYCQECLDFDADVEPPVYAYAFNGPDEMRYKLGDTVVRCANRKLCGALRNRLMKGVKE